MRRSITYLFVATLWMASSLFQSSRADDWAQWRGPNRDGISQEKGLRSTWPENGPTLVWQAKDLGAGFSTPSVVGDRLYVITNQGSEKEDVVALATSSGEKIWSTNIGKVGENRGPQYPGTRSTPTVSGDALYALGSNGDLCCIDSKSGSIRWRKNLKTDFSGAPGAWAYSESPLIDGDTLVCSPGGAAETVIALNKSNGNLIWKSALPEADESAYSSPIIANVDGVKQYVLFLGKGAVGLKADNGEVLWRYLKTSDVAANIATPIVKGNFVYTAASRVGSALIQVASRKAEPKEIYFAKSLPAGIGGSVLVGDYLYGSAGPAMTCVEYATGTVKWQDRSIGEAAVCYADGRLYLHGENNEVAMVEASPAGYKLLGKVTPPNASERGSSKAWTHPVIANGMLYIRDQGSVWCYNIK